MANVLTNIMPKILAAGLSTLREAAIMPRLVNSSYSDEAAQKGTTIDIPVPTAISVIDVAPSNTPPAPTDETPGLVQVPLDQWKQNEPFYLTDKELVQIDRNRHFVPMQVAEAVKALANNVNAFIHSQYKGIYGFTGTAGTTPFGSSAGDATQARKILNEQLCPKSDRRMVLDFAAEAAALDLSTFADAEKTADQGMVKIEGEIGRKYGFDIFADDQVVTHTKGTLNNGTNATAEVDGAFAAGVSTINLANTTLTGTLVEGDVVSFAGHSQTYVITNSPSITAASNAMTGVTISPALQQALTDNEVMTLEDSHVVNLAFHRDAFAFAQRPLVASTMELALGSEIMSLQDPQTGVVLRLEVSRQHKQVAWEFDILYGAKLVRPELATRIAG